MPRECGSICDDWTRNIHTINRPFELEAARNPGYKGYGGKPFEYCPWCGAPLVERDDALLKPNMTDSEKIDLALWALNGGAYWLAHSIKRGPAEYCVVTATSAYGAVTVIEESYHSDPWQALRLAKAATATGSALSRSGD